MPWYGLFYRNQFQLILCGRLIANFMSLAVALNLQAVQHGGGQLGNCCAFCQDWVLLYNCQLIDQRASPNRVVNQIYLVSKVKERKTLGNDTSSGAKSLLLQSRIFFVSPKVFFNFCQSNFGYNPAASGYQTQTLLCPARSRIWNLAHRYYSGGAFIWRRKRFDKASPQHSFSFFLLIYICGHHHYQYWHQNDLVGEACWRFNPNGGVPLSGRQNCHLCCCLSYTCQCVILDKKVTAWNVAEIFIILLSSGECCQTTMRQDYHVHFVQ